MKAYRFSSINQYVSQQMSQLSHAQFPLRRHPHLLVDHRRAGSASVADSRGADAERLTGSGGRLHFGMVAGFKSERWPASNRNRWPDCVGIRNRRDAGDKEPISCSSACDIEQPPLGLVYVFKLHLVPGGIDALSQRQLDGLEFETFSVMH